MTASVPVASSVLERLKAANVAPAYIVDDAFDPPRVGDDVEQFWFEVRKDDALRAEIEAIQPVADASDIGPEVIRAIWELRDRSPLLKVLADQHLFASRLQQVDDLERIEAHLREAGLDPQRRGINEDIPATARLVFLDYVLDPSRTLELAKLAADRAVQLYDAAPADAKPFIVLMSDHPDAAKQHTSFRAESRLMGGLFAFIKKAEARERERLYFRLGTWGIANENFTHLQRFVVAVLQGLQDAVKTFTRRVYSLDVHDYSFIQKECLYKDGQPLGDYLMWLFEASLGHSLRNHGEVVKLQGQLDAMRFDKLLPCDRVPSANLAEFYESAVTEPAVEELKPHPLDPDGAAPLLYLGDVFLQEKTKSVLLVLSAACDLQYRPTDKLKSDPGQPVYLAPGELKALGAGHARAANVCTELVSLNEQPYRIEWDYKHVGAQPLGSVATYLSDRGYKRHWRLRLPYALEVQQAFVANVSRVGMPVPPAYVQQADVEIYGPVGAGGSGERMGERIVGGIGVAEHKGQEMCVLTPACVDGMITRLDEVADRVVAIAEELPADAPKRGERVAAATRRAEAIRELKSKTDLWVSLVEEPFELPKSGGSVTLKPNNKGLVWAYRGVDLTKQKFGNQPTFAVSINILGDGAQNEGATGSAEAKEGATGTAQARGETAGETEIARVVATAVREPAHDGAVGVRPADYRPPPDAGMDVALVDETEKQ